jgi:signal transduction histidine kinase/DNA-binding response OmpR family regulator
MHVEAPRTASDAAALRLVPGALLVLVAPLLVSASRGVVIAGAVAIGLSLVGAVGWRRRGAAVVPTQVAREGGAQGAALATLGVSDEALSPELSWALDIASDAVLVTDVRGTIVRASARVRAILGDEVRRGTAFAAAGTFAAGFADAAEFARAVRQLYADPTARGSGEISAVQDDRVHVYEWTSEPVRAADGRVVGRGFVLRDRTQERELSTLRREFLSTVTHELRTPLTSVKGSLQLVLGKASALSAIERELLAISLKNTDRLIRLINDILDISQLELGKMDLTFGSVAPVSLVEEAIAGLRSYAAGHDIALGSELDSDLPLLAGDRDRLIQVLTNLVSNAVKFSPTGGRVLVRVTCAAGELRIAVHDWGVGIRPCDHDRLFQRFQRLHPGRGDEPGTGLGLAISKAIVDRHGGRITVESEEAVGSTFTVILPVPAVDAAIAAVGAEPTAAVGARRPTLLLIDDDADLGTVLEVSLGGAYRLLRVERGVQALDVARVERPDLVLLDVVLPDLSGYDVLRILQHSEATRRIPVVMLTVQPERMLARGLGAADVVAKPVDVDELRRAIERTLHPPIVGTALRVAVGPLVRASVPLRAALEAKGHIVVTAADTWELVHCADEQAPDVAIVETSGEAEGESTIAFLRGHATTQRLPLVLLTAAAGPMARGCTRVPPGVSDAELVRMVEEAAERTRAPRGNVDVA